MSTPTEVMNRFIREYQAGGDEAVAQELLADDFVDHTPFPGFGGTRQDVMNLFRVIRVAFPDLTVRVHDQFEQGDRVATRKTFQGTHQGPFAGIPATGRTIRIPVMDIVRIEGGKLREHWNVVDLAEVMRQLTETVNSATA